MRSGTGVVEDVLYRQMRHLAARLHTLVIEHEAAATAVVDLACSMARDQWEQLQVSASSLCLLAPICNQLEGLISTCTHTITSMARDQWEQLQVSVRQSVLAGTKHPTSLQV